MHLVKVGARECGWQKPGKQQCVPMRMKSGFQDWHLHPTAVWTSVGFPTWLPPVLHTNRGPESPASYLYATFPPGLFPFSPTIQCTGQILAMGQWQKNIPVLPIRTGISVLPYPIREAKREICVFFSDLLLGRVVLWPLSYQWDIRSCFCWGEVVLQSIFLPAGRRQIVLAPTFLLSIFLPWIQMWHLEAHGLLVTRKWWHLRARAKGTVSIQLSCWPCSSSHLPPESY